MDKEALRIKGIIREELEIASWRMVEFLDENAGRSKSSIDYQFRWAVLQGKLDVLNRVVDRVGGGM